MRDLNVKPLQRDEARQWGLALAARKIPHQFRQTDEGWWITVTDAVEPHARKEISRFLRENFDWPPESPAPPYSTASSGESLLPVFSVLILLATFHNLTLIDPREWGFPAFDWDRIGCAHAGKILRGEWWRTITALTLHADYLHLGSNLVMAAILLPRLCRAFGTGRTWFLVLLSGLLGNGINAIFQPYHHQAIGSSTALFGALGLLVGAGFRKRLPNLRKSLLPLCAGLALLAWVGSGGERTDLGGHFFGFSAGVMIGLFIAIRNPSSGPKGASSRTPLLTYAAVILPLAAWGFAIVANVQRP